MPGPQVAINALKRTRFNDCVRSEGGACVTSLVTWLASLMVSSRHGSRVLPYMERNLSVESVFKLKEDLGRPIEVFGLFRDSLMIMQDHGIQLRD